MHVVDVQIIAIGLHKNTGGYALTNISNAQANAVHIQDLRIRVKIWIKCRKKFIQIISIVYPLMLKI
jgi:uncharacterized protein YlxW (UPF0749 family)